MAVLVEAISVIVRVDAIEARFPGGWPAFVAAAPNRTLCMDGEIARIGFMTPVDVRSFIDRLEAAGLVFLRDGVAVDVAVADQQMGPTVRAPWLEVGRVPIEAGRVTLARLAGSTIVKLHFPDDWKLEGSLSATFGFVPLGREDKSLEFLRHEDGLDVYRSRLTGEEVFLGRTSEAFRKGDA